MAGSLKLARVSSKRCVPSGTSPRLRLKPFFSSTRADAPDGVERERAAAAAGVSFQAALILMVASGAWLVVRGDYAAAAVTYGAVVVVIAVFWTSYSLLRRRF